MLLSLEETEPGKGTFYSTAKQLKERLEAKNKEIEELKVGDGKREQLINEFEELHSLEVKCDRNIFAFLVGSIDRPRSISEYIKIKEWLVSEGLKLKEYKILSRFFPHSNPSLGFKEDPPAEFVYLLNQPPEEEFKAKFNKGIGTYEYLTSLFASRYITYHNRYQEPTNSKLKAVKD